MKVLVSQYKNNKVKLKIKIYPNIVLNQIHLFKKIKNIPKNKNKKIIIL